MQMVALVVLIVQHEKAAEALRLYHIGEGLLVIAGVLTLWSGLYYLRAAWPILSAEVAARPQGGNARSEGRRVGKECVSTCRSRRSPFISTKTSCHIKIVRTVD